MKISLLKLFNYLPVGYVFQSRIITIAERISWLLIFPIFLLFIVLLNNGGVIHFIISFLIVLSAYEIGYLYNDVITTKNEKDPTIRHEAFHEDNFLYCLAIRSFFCAFLCAVLFYVYGIKEFSLGVISVLVINFIFYMHNKIRSRFNVITYFLLVSSRYIFPVILLIEPIQFIWIVLIFPLCRTLEHACKKKYKLIFLTRIIGKPDTFRVYYLLFITIAASFFDTVFLYMAVYFLLVRLLALFVSRYSFFKRNHHGAYK